jgi:hypothetical protein
MSCMNPMKNAAVFMLILLTLTPIAFGAGRPLPPPGMPPSAPEGHRQRVEGPDRTITWRQWQEMPGGNFRVRTGDRYLGDGKWQHYLVFEQSRACMRRIRFSLIHLGSEPIADAETSPRSRFAIVVITNGVMTARKGLWSWSAQEVATEPLDLRIDNLLSESAKAPDYRRSVDRAS